jgi:hypothetical protein
MPGKKWKLLAIPVKIPFWTGEASRNTVPSKKKKSKFKIGTEARRRARLGIGLPPPERTITEKRLKKPKHKKKLEDLVVED